MSQFFVEVRAVVPNPEYDDNFAATYAATSSDDSGVAYVSSIDQPTAAFLQDRLNHNTEQAFFDFLEALLNVTTPEEAQALTGREFSSSTED